MKSFATIGERRRGALKIACSLFAAALILTGCATTSNEQAPRQLTLQEAYQGMLDDGSYVAHVTPRKKVGRMTFPKYPGKAWEWFNERRVAIGEDSLPKNYRNEAYQRALRGNMDKSKLRVRAANWTPIHPSGGVQPSGRLIEIVVDPNNDQIIYAASASGGLWKTTDQGRNWSNVSDGHLPTIGMGSITMDPFDSNVLYAGLGEGVPGAYYEPIGAGIYKSSNAGASWSPLGNSASVMAFVTDIKVLNNSNTLLASSGGQRGGAGLFRSTDGGQTWNSVSNAGHFSISVDPANRMNVLITSQFIGGNGGQIFYSTNAGQTFTASTIPPNGNVDRIELTRSGQTIYALASALPAAEGVFIGGIWKSTNNGQTFTALPLTGIPTSGIYRPSQMNYNCGIGVSPYDPNIVYLGSNLRMYKSTNGGQSWTAKSDWIGEDGLPYVHADHHDIHFGSTTDIVYFATDGGFFVSTDGGTTWAERNINMTALQIYRMDNHPTNENALVMGLQDNDKYVRRADGVWEHYPNSFGDAMEVLSWPNDPEVFFGCNYNGSAVRVTEDGSRTQWPLIRGYQQFNNGIPDNESGAWISPFFFDPNNPSTLYLALNGVYRTTYTKGQFPQWTQIIAPTAGQSPAQMEAMVITRGNSNRKLMWFTGRRTQTQFLVGLKRANPDGTNLENLQMPQLGWVADIEADPNNNESLWIVYSNLNAAPAENKRIYKTTNLGNSWTDMTNNFPVNTPANAVMVDPNNSNTIFIGTDIGVFRSDDGGGSWAYWNEGLPPVVVTDFSYFGPTRKLRASTYGRGMFETPIEGGASAPSIRISPETIDFN